MTGLPFASPGQRIGLLGGSFNPAHRGHLHVSRVALAQLALDRVWWLVSPQNPLKASADMASLAVRLEGARAVARDPRLRVFALESQLGTRFTIDTVRALKRRYPHVRFVWLMGADNLASFHRWRDWRGIMAALPVAVVARPGSSFAALSSPAARRFAGARIAPSRARGLAGRAPPAWTLLLARLDPTSSTALRARRAPR